MRLRLMALATLTLITGLLGAQNMFGAFQIVTEPAGATITLTGSSQYLGTTPSQVFPVMMDQYMVYNCGIPGRVFNIYISKDGYVPIQQEIFVPYNKVWQQDAIRYPTLFSFVLTRAYVQPPSYCPPPPPRPAPPRPGYWFNWNFPRRHHHYDNNPGPGHQNPPSLPPHGDNPNPGGHGPGSGHGGHGHN